MKSNEALSYLRRFTTRALHIAHKYDDAPLSAFLNRQLHLINELESAIQQDLESLSK